MHWFIKCWLGVLFLVTAALAAIGLLYFPPRDAGILCLPFTFTLPVYLAVTIVRLLGRAWRQDAIKRKVARG